MEIVFDSILKSEDERAVRQIAMECGVMIDTARLLFCRGINTVESAIEFLNPGKDKFIDPLLLSGMENAAKRITDAKIKGEKVLIFGDYDADGICAVTVLSSCLKKFGITPMCMIPEREEGYGLNVEKILSGEKPDLIITVDCGISDKNSIAKLIESGIDVIVTDHHEPPEDLPETILINPKLKGQKYGFSELCGAGVAYKLGYALIGEEADSYLDFVSLATVADSMELIGENRSIVAEGLKLFNNNRRDAFTFLLGENCKEITSQTLAFSLAPKINAGGRMGDATAALNLFLTESLSERAVLAEKLKSYNVERQVACDEIYKKAKEKIFNEELYRNDVILVYDESWKTGFIGIVAARLVEDFSRPFVVFAEHNGILKGSARSVSGINIYEVISSAKDLLEGFGGHSQAAGVSVRRENIEKVNKAFNEYLEKNQIKPSAKKELHAEWLIDGKITERFVREIDLLEPFGAGNRQPVFAIRTGAVNPKPLKAGSAHYSFSTEYLEMLDFGGEKHVPILLAPTDKTIVFLPSLSTFKNRVSLKGIVKGVVADKVFGENLPLYLFDKQIKKIQAGEKDSEDIKDISDLSENGGFNRLYVLSDIENVEKFKDLNLPVSLFYPEKTNGENCIVILPEEIPDNYKEIVYLDRPLSATKTPDKTVYRNDALIGYSPFLSIKTDRVDMIACFNLLRRQAGRPFNGSVNFSLETESDIDKFTLVFAIDVFIELGIFEVRNGIFKENQGLKNPLTNSLAYSKISILKAQNV